MGGLKGKKIVCIGSNLESQKVLSEIILHKKTIDGLITLSPQKKEMVSDYVDLQPFCQKYSIPIIHTSDVNSKKTIEAIAEWNPDYLFTLGWSQLFSTQLINQFAEMVIGSHPTPLPHRKGRAPIPWTILSDQRTSAVSFFKIDEGVDSGPIILQKDFNIPDRIFAKELYDLASQKLSEGFLEIYEMIENDKPINAVPQNQSAGSSTAKRVPAHGLLNFHKSVADVDRLIRAVSFPYPGAYFYYKDTRVSVHYSQPEYSDEFFAIPGQILGRSKDGIKIKCKDGCIWLSQLIGDDGNSILPDFFKLHGDLGYQVQDQLYLLRKVLMERGVDL